MLDGRWDRAPLPCEVRRDWCERIVLPSNSTAALRKHPWCEDFLTTGGLAGAGSCCKADEAIFWGWCLELGSKSDPLWRIACDPSFPGFASQPLVLHDDALHPPGPSVQDAEEDGSPICEVLGRRQREWLEDVLTTRATAPLKIIASGSVLLGDPVTINEDTTDWEGQCSGDDWDCYRPAQLALLSALQRGAAAAGGCVVVAAGDFHFSDIRAAFPGGKTPANYPPSSSDSAAQGAAWQQGYSDVYATDGWTTPIYQVPMLFLFRLIVLVNVACKRN
jgi:alkaline phosphatase D